MEYELIDKAAMEFKWHAEKKMLENLCRQYTMVPSDVLGNLLNIVLVRSMELVKWMFHQNFGTQTPGKQLGILQHSANFHLEPQLIQI